ncbi:MAG: hypothetical protein AAFX93_05590 [Verrucomicrobiota bacterium]
MPRKRSHRSRKKRSRAPQIIAGLLVFFLVLGAAFIVWLSKQSPSDAAEYADAELSPEAVEEKPQDFAQPAQSVSEIVDRYIAVQGGVDEINKISSLRFIGVIREAGEEIEFDQLRKAPNLYRFTLERDGRELRTTTNGKQVWRELVGREATYEIVGQEAEDFINSAPILEKIWTQRNVPGALKLLEDQPLDGKMHHRISVKLAGGGKEVYWIDNKSYLESRKEKFNAKGDRITLFEFSDFRPVGTMNIPFFVAITNEGAPTTEVTINKAEMNVGVFSSFFEPPKQLLPWPEKETAAN